MKDHLITGITAGLVVWALVGVTNSAISKVGEQEKFEIAIPTEVLEPQIDVDEMHCLAKNIYFEARGETLEGKIAVANVTMNRVNSLNYPNTLCGVVYQAKHSKWWQEHNGSLVPIRNQCQFSWYCDGKSDRLYLTTSSGTVIKDNMNAWIDSVHIAEEAIRGNLNDITQGALWYHADFVQPYWSTHYKEVTKVGAHIFYTSH